MATAGARDKNLVSDDNRRTVAYITNLLNKTIREAALLKLSKTQYFQYHNLTVMLRLYPAVTVFRNMAKAFAEECGFV